MTRSATWTNSDGLVVGFGQEIFEREAAGEICREGREVQVGLDITYLSTLGSSGAKITIPAKSLVTSVYFKVGDAWTGGTSLTFGDATDPDGFMTAAGIGAQAALTAGKFANEDGAYTTPKEYASATDLYFTGSGTWTAGTMQVLVTYIV